jgi:hypothetical protein
MTDRIEEKNIFWRFVFLLRRQPPNSWIGLLFDQSTFEFGLDF